MPDPLIHHYENEALDTLGVIENSVNERGVDDLVHLEALAALTYAVLHVGQQLNRLISVMNGDHDA